MFYSSITKEISGTAITSQLSVLSRTLHVVNDAKRSVFRTILYGRWFHSQFRAQDENNMFNLKELAKRKGAVVLHVNGETASDRLLPLLPSTTEFLNSDSHAQY